MNRNEDRKEPSLAETIAHMATNVFESHKTGTLKTNIEHDLKQTIMTDDLVILASVVLTLGSGGMGTVINLMELMPIDRLGDLISVIFSQHFCNVIQWGMDNGLEKELEYRLSKQGFQEAMAVAKAKEKAMKNGTAAPAGGGKVNLDDLMPAGPVDLGADPDPIDDAPPSEVEGKEKSPESEPPVE